MDLVPRLVFTRMLHKGFCSTFQYPCSFIFFILYRFIFTLFLLIRNPPLQLTNSTKMDFFQSFPSSETIDAPKLARMLLGGSSCAALRRQTTFQIFLSVHQTQIVQHFSSHSQGSTNTKFQHFSNLSQGSSQIFFTSLNTNFRHFSSRIVIFGPFWVILGHSWAILGLFGPFWVIFGPLWAILGHPGVILGHPGVILGSSWVILGHP